LTVERIPRKEQNQKKEKRDTRGQENTLLEKNHNTWIISLRLILPDILGSELLLSLIAEHKISSVPYSKKGNPISNFIR